jgi:hypothetical protein
MASLADLAAEALGGSEGEDMETKIEAALACPCIGENPPCDAEFVIDDIGA